MNILNLVISSLSKEKIRYFKVLATRMEGPTDRKDLQLLDYIRKIGNNLEAPEALTTSGRNSKSARAGIF